jgi:hypothetical protein
MVNKPLMLEIAAPPASVLRTRTTAVWGAGRRKNQPTAARARETYIFEGPASLLSGSAFELVAFELRATR